MARCSATSRRSLIHGAKGCRVEFSCSHRSDDGRVWLGERPVDVLFVGGYSRHHLRRAKIFERIAGLAASRQVVFCLDASRLTRLAESPSDVFRAEASSSGRYRGIAKAPVFGRGLYELIGKSKIVLNGAIDMAGGIAATCGALRPWDAARCWFRTPAIIRKEWNRARRSGLHVRGACFGCDRKVWIIGRMRQNRQPRKARVSEIYSKSLQWLHFVDLVARTKPC